MNSDLPCGRALKYLLVIFLPLTLGFTTLVEEGRAQNPDPPRSIIPRTWDDTAMSTLEIPLATPVGSPKHVSADYYYQFPVRPIYKSYPVYVAGHEPPGYIESLRKQEPVIT